MDGVCLCSILHSAPVKNFSGSSYIFYRSNGNWYDWERSKTICEQSGYNLVSAESREEWNFLKENCALMYRNYNYNYGRYNDVSCTVSLKRAGFICEFKGGGGNRLLIHITRN